MSGTLSNIFPDENASSFLRVGAASGSLSAEVYDVLNQRNLKREIVKGCLQNILSRLDFLTVREFLIVRGREPFEDLRTVEEQVKEQYLLDSGVSMVSFRLDAKGDILFPQSYHGAIEIVVLRKIREECKNSKIEISS